MLVTSHFARKLCHWHISQYLKFQGILEFVGRQLVPSTIFSEPSIHPNVVYLVNIFWGNVTTQLRWGRKLCTRIPGEQSWTSVITALVIEENHIMCMMTWYGVTHSLNSREYHSVTRQCYTVVRVTQQVNGKWQFWGYQNSVTLNRSTKNLTHVGELTSYAKFHKNRRHND